MKKVLLIIVIASIWSCNKPNKSERKEVVLPGKGLIEIPDSVYEMDGLVILDLGANDNQTNKIENLKSDVSNWEKLEILNLSNNQLKTIPKELGKLENLKQLDLSYNPNLNIENEISTLKALKSLKFLNIIKTQVNNEVIIKLKSELKGVQIVDDSSLNK